MPYASPRQQRFFHTDTARRQGITPEMVREFDEAERTKRVKSAGLAKLPVAAPAIPKLPTAPALPKMAPPISVGPTPALKSLHARSESSAGASAGSAPGDRLNLGASRKGAGT